MAGGKTDKILTAEPAVAVPAISDTNYRDFSSDELPSLVAAPSPESESKSMRQQFASLGSQQFGAFMRRSVMVQPSAVMTDADDLKDSKKDGSDAPMVKLSSLGRIREGGNGEMYIVESTETDKDK